MPFFRDESGFEWPDDDSDPPPPKPGEFGYLSPKDYGGDADTARFKVPALEDVARKLARPRGSLLDRVLGRKPKEEPVYDPGLAAIQTEAVVAIMVPALRELGLKALYCRLDGGHDEGFSWLDSGILRDGSRIDAAEVNARLRRAGVLKKLQDLVPALRSSRQSEEVQMKDVLDLWLIQEWASLLLGGGFGTGEYTMYGAFTVDLETCTITDDRNADPVVENIQIAP